MYLTLTGRAIKSNAARQHCFSLLSVPRHGCILGLHFDPLTFYVEKLMLFLPPANGSKHHWESILSILWTSVFGVKVIIVLCTWNHTVMRHITFSYSQWGGKKARKMEITSKMTLVDFHSWLSRACFYISGNWHGSFVIQPGSLIPY